MKRTKSHKPNLKVYFSASIQGVPEADKNFPWELVCFMKDNDIEVLSPHVAARTEEERTALQIECFGSEEFLTSSTPWHIIRREDINRVNAATHVVAVVNGPSHGVGMELQRALDKPAAGLNVTPILCLIHENNLEKLTWMVRGVPDEHFYLKTYVDLEDAKGLVMQFLTEGL